MEHVKTRTQSRETSAPDRKLYIALVHIVTRELLINGLFLVVLAVL